jgi:hypothetical protein
MQLSIAEQNAIATKDLNLPPVKSEEVKIIEYFCGDRASKAFLTWTLNKGWVSHPVEENSSDSSVVQIRVNGYWAAITQDNEILLDRLLADSLPKFE